jgi:nucleoside-diphosphate-sugar epimerase
VTEGGVLIAGCGDLGERLGRLLVDEGVEVFGLRRDPRGLAPGIRRIAADLGEAKSLEQLPRGPRTIVHAASADAFTDEAYRRAHVDGLRNLLAAVDPPKRLVLVSSSSVYGQLDGSWVNESSPTSDAAFSQRCLLEGERLAAEAGGIVLRLSGIYGPGRTKMLDRVRAGEATYAPDREQWTNRIHADCAARAVRLLLAVEEPEPLYLGVDDEPAPRRTVLEWLAERLGAPAPRAAESPVRKSDRPRTSKRCSNRLLRAAGWRPQYPSWREGYEVLISAGP